MVLLYRGNLESLAAEVRDVAPHVKAAYERILGKPRADKLADMANRLLPAQAFYASPEEVEQGLGERLPPNASNKMLLGSNSEVTINPDGTISRQKIRTTVAFYISETGFHHSGSVEFTERPVASYIHEFDHFIWYALQRVPLYLVNLFSQQVIGADLSSGLDGMCRAISAQDILAADKINRAYLAINTQVLIEVYEHANRILDKKVLESIGIDVPLPWRHQPRAYMDLPLPSGRVVRIPQGGDIFAGLSDEQVIERVLDWENKMHIQLQIPYMQNLDRSVRNLKVSRVPITEME